MGRASEVTLPEIKQKMKELEALGLYGSMEFPVGLEKLESKIKWNSYYSEVMANAGNPLASHRIQVRSSLEERTSNGMMAQRPVVCEMSGTFSNLPLGSFKKGDPIDQDTTIAISAIKLSIDGAVILDIDIPANVYKVNGVDILAKFKQNLGLGQGVSRGDIPVSSDLGDAGLIIM